MTGNATILIAVILFSIVLIAFLVLRPSITVTRGGKMLAFVAMLIFKSVTEAIDRRRSAGGNVAA